MKDLGLGRGNLGDLEKPSKMTEIPNIGVGPPFRAFRKISVGNERWKPLTKTCKN